MTPLNIHLDAEQDRIDMGKGLAAHGMIDSIGLLRNGTSEGKASVAITIKLADGSVVLGETTWALLRMAYTALAASPIIAEEVIDP